LFRIGDSPKRLSSVKMLLSVAQGILFASPRRSALLLTAISVGLIPNNQIQPHFQAFDEHDQASAGSQRVAV
jgi:hypothetical protein